MRENCCIEMSNNVSVNVTFDNHTADEVLIDGMTVRAATLVLMQCFIIPGNALILAAIATFTKRTVSDVLIGCLALMDLLNGLGPVNISIIMYYISFNGVHHMYELKWLCSSYTWTSTCLRLMACFVATSMAIDRFAAIVVPLFYRTRVTPKAACYCLLFLFAISTMISTIPLAVEKIQIYVPLCSFDFTSPYAAFIAVLGYLQLLVVVLCYLSVISGVNAFLSRQTMIRATQIRASIAASKSKNRENTLVDTSYAAGIASPKHSQNTKQRHLSVDSKGNLQNRLRSASLLPIRNTPCQALQHYKRSQSLTPVMDKRKSLSRILSTNRIYRSRSISVYPEIKISTNICRAYSNEQDARKRGSDLEIMQEAALEREDEARVQISLKEFKKNNSTWRHSRKLAIVMGVVVLLFYISWMPIVVN